MAKKIEHLLRAMGDLHRFSEDSNAASNQVSDELWEEDLELIAAASQAPMDWDTFKRKHADRILEPQGKN